MICRDSADPSKVAVAHLVRLGPPWTGGLRETGLLALT